METMIMYDVFQNVVFYKQYVVNAQFIIDYMMIFVVGINYISIIIYYNLYKMYTMVNAQSIICTSLLVKKILDHLLGQSCITCDTKNHNISNSSLSDQSTAHTMIHTAWCFTTVFVGCCCLIYQMIKKREREKVAGGYILVWWHFWITSISCLFTVWLNYWINVTFSDFDLVSRSHQHQKFQT